MKVSGSHVGRKVLAVVGTFAICTAGFAVPSVAAAPDAKAAADGNVVAAQVSSQNARTAEGYWTIERMATAKSADTLVSAAAGSTKVADYKAGAPTSVGPTAGSVPAASSPELQHATSVSRPYTNLPDRLNGKVFFTLNGSNYVCSGTVVNSTNKDMVDTAGHCVSDGSSTFATNWIFVPAYSSGKTKCNTAATCYPYGRWSARTLATRAEWHNFYNLKQDLGYGVLNTLNGRHIVNYLGGHGSTFNQSRNQTWKAYGYPAAAPFNGYDQKVCTSGRLANDNPSVRPGPLTIRIHCNMTGGSSGGGWIVRMSSAGLGYVNSHTSYGYSNQPDRLYGPYYGNEALSLYNYARTL